MSRLPALEIQGEGFFAKTHEIAVDGVPALAALLQSGHASGGVGKPIASVLEPAERRRAPISVALALHVAAEACAAAGADPKSLPAVFASTHGDLGITEYMCEVMATAPRDLSPTKFHNSVHNAAAGYWTIGTGSMHAATALSAFDCTFAAGLLEAAAQAIDGNEPVLLVCYDIEGSGALGEITGSVGLVGYATVLAPCIAQSPAARAALTLSRQSGAANPVPAPTPLAPFRANAMWDAVVFAAARLQPTVPGRRGGLLLPLTPDSSLKVEWT